MKVKKSTKKQSPPPRDVACLIDRILNASNGDLLTVLQEFPSWRYPRGDLHSWIGVLDKFDTILAETITSYDLTKIQTNHFTPKTKELVMEILRVLNLLLGNCTNRKLFASYDRLYDLLLTEDLDILQSCLYVLLRPAQQYASQTPYERPLGRKLSARLLTLARGLDSLRSQGIGLKALTSEEELTISEEAASLSISFYPTTRHPTSSEPDKSGKLLPSKSPKAGTETATTVELGNVLETMSPDMPDRLSELAEKYGMGPEDQYETLNKVRWILALKSKSDREKLVSARLLAIATYAFLATDDAAQSSIFLYEPDLIPQIAELVSTTRNVAESVQAAALFALDAVAHHRSKLSETLTALGANLNHGILMSQFRAIVDKLAKGEQVSHELVDGVITFVAFIAASPHHGNMLIGAGIIPILLEMLRTKSDKRDSYIPRATGLIDAVVLSHPQSLPMFSNVDGVNNLVARIRAEIDKYLDLILPEATESMSEETIIFYQTNPLRAVLRSVHRLMQTSGGQEGLRNLVDSDLPKSVKRIFENSRKFGPRVFALAINVMATFVHNEPTSLTILQEQQLPQTLVGVLETEIPPSFDVMATIPNAIGAICLNQTGLDYITAHPTVLVNLINVAASETTTESSDRENAQQIGGSLDELARHHPTLKPVILDAMMNLLRRSIEAGNSFTPPTEALPEYSLQALAESSSPSDDTKTPKNEALNAFTKLFKILDGLLRNASLAKDFIKEGGVKLLMSISDLNCIPLRFGSTSASLAFSNLLRVIGDTDHVQLSETIILSIQEVMGVTTALWKDDNAPAHWIALQKREADSRLIDQFNRLPGLSIRLAYLSETFAGLAWSHSRIATALIRSLGVSSGSSFVSDLAKLHRICFREHARIAPQTTAAQKNQTPLTAAPSTVIGIDEVDSIPTSSGSSLNLAAQLMTTRLHAVLTRVFKTAIKLLFIKRNPDSSHRKEAGLLAVRIAEEIVEHLKEPASGEKSIDTETVAVGLATILLFDERGHDGRLNTILFLKFERAGGMSLLLLAIGRIISHMDEVTKTPVNDRTEDQKSEIIRTVAGIRISFLVLVALVEPMSLLESSQTLALQQRTEESEQWDPMDTFLKIRVDVLPLAHRVWSADWLRERPASIIKQVTRAFLTIMEGNNEDAGPLATGPIRIPPVAAHSFANPPAPRPPVVADPARIAQLVDMGFPRGSADFALVRARNNVAAATELLLTMPHLFQDLGSPIPPAEADPAPMEATEPVPEEAAQEDAPARPQSAPGVPNMSAEVEFAEVVGSAMDMISAAFGIEVPQVNAEASDSGLPENDTEAPRTETENHASEPESQSSMEIDAEPTVPLREQLAKLRSDYRPDIASRALNLLDGAQDLVFDLLPAFPTGTQGANFLLEKTLETVRGSSEDREKQLSARLRMLAVFIREVEDVLLDQDALQKVVDIILPLANVPSPRPSWTCALQLFAEASFAVSEVINVVKIGDDSSSPVVNVPTVLDCTLPSLTQIAMTILGDDKSTRDELLSSLRLLMVVTRKHRHILTTEITQKILGSFTHPSPNLHGCQPYIAMILRHAFEDRETLADVMRQEIRRYLTPARNKVTDVNHFVRQLRQVATRDPAVFVEAIEKECTLIDPSPPQSVYHIRTKETKKEAPVAADPFQDNDEARKAIPMIEILIVELGNAINQTRSVTPEPSTDEGSKEEDPEKGKKNPLGYLGLIISALTEILGSYGPAKKAFMTAIRKHGLIDKVAHKNGLATLVNDVICGIDLTDDLTGNESKPSQESTNRLALSSWTSSMLVALCADVSAQSDDKGISEDLTHVRKTVLDAVAKAIKDLSSTDPSLRYGRLWAIGELTYRLLLSRPSIPNQPTDDSSTHIAKIMLEKHFVSLLTAATGEVDLNFPGVRIVLGSLLRALEHLTKISIKWSKGEKGKSDKLLPASESSTDSEESDVDMDMTDEEQDAAPDLYRNSALGMLGGDIRDEDSDDEDDDDDDDEDMMDAYGDDMMDEIMDDDSQTEPSDAEDEDDDGTDGDEWTDEEMEEGDGEDMEGPEVVIGDPRPVDEANWEDDMDDHESMMTDEEDGMLEMGFDDGGMFDENPEEGEEEDMEEEDYDELDLMGALPPPDQLGFSSRSEVAGHWGWEQSTGEQRQAPPGPAHRMSTLLDPDGGSSAMALFGGSSQRSPTTAPAQPPLITQPPAATVTRRPPRGATNLGDLFATLEEMGGSQAVQMLETLLSRHARNTESIRINFAQGDNGQIDLSIGNRSFHVPPHDPSLRESRAAEDIVAECVPKPTLHRWNEEMNVTPILQNKDFLGLLTIHIINRLLPEAKLRHEEETEKAKKEEEEHAKLEAEERKKEAEEAAKVALPESRATPIPPEPSNPPADAPASRGDDVEMRDESTQSLQTSTESLGLLQQAIAAASQITDRLETSNSDVTLSTPLDQSAGANEGVPSEVLAPETTPAGASAPEASAPETLARTVVMVHGREVDITDTGIDLEFLQALPDDMRADVIEQHMRENQRLRRQPAPEADASHMASSSINAEFLDALPPELRAEVIMQEAMENARRNRPSRGDGGGNDERPRILAVDPLSDDTRITGEGGIPANFLTRLDDDLRDMMLLGPSGGSGGTAASVFRTRAPIDWATPKQQSRESIQLLEKPGIASLVRLLFFPESFKKTHLFRILANLCENSSTRSELLNLLLSVIQDGSGDLPLVDRSFQQMSLRAMATPKSTGKTKAAESPAPFLSTGLFAHLQTDNIPAFIAQRCLEALTHIVGANSQAVHFFLTEQEQGVGLKKVSTKKGKGKEKLLPQTKYPIVILLGLLDRPALLSTAGMMDSLTALLANITRPLSILDPEASKESNQPKRTDIAEPAPATLQPDAQTAAVNSVSTPAAPNTTTATAESSAKADVGTRGGITKPPVVPASVLRLVVNCLTTSECSSRNFSQSLIVMQNLCNIPDAKETLLQELRDRSQKLGSTLQDELMTLAASLADEKFEATSPALTVFSSPSSHQAQLLRLLKTIEYLHLNKVDSDPPGDVMTEKEEEVSKVYGSFDFDPMWSQLRQCLSLVEAREDTEQISLILLPLVEALMVVCKYRRAPSREVRSPSAPPHSAVSDTSDLFLSFTTVHRKVLNTIVRNNPALLGGSFSLLIRNSRVLEFDNKRQWFFQKLKRKKDQIVPAGVLHLNVRRQYVFEDSFRALQPRSGDEIKYGKLGVKFHNEDGIDAGGVSREWYSVLAQQIFDPNFALFEPCAADKQTYQPNKHSSVNGDHLAYFKFIGRIIGKAVYDGRLLDAYFSRAFYKQILGRTVDMRDLESIDPEYHKSLQWMLDNDITGVIDQEFTFEDDQFGEKKTVELKEGGASIPVTEENKEEYVRLVVSYRLDNSIKEQNKAFLDGFYDIIPRQLIQIFEPDQLELLISGITTIDVDELKNATQMSGWKSSDPEVAWFWRALRSFSQEERSRFLMFVTSSSRVPLGGFTQLQGASGIQPFQIQKLYAKEGSLPQASTCFNLLLLPKYASYEQLRERLQFAVTETGGFGKA